MLYKRGKFTLETDCNLRTVREDPSSGDVDILIDTQERSMNLFLPSIDPHLVSRIQLPQVKYVLIRFCEEKHSNRATIHFLRNIDLQSHMINFELNYEKHGIRIVEGEYSIDFCLSTMKLG